MKLKILVISVLFFSLWSGYYVARTQLFPPINETEIPESKIVLCQTNQQVCADFKVIDTSEDVPAYVGYLIIRNASDKNFAEIKDIFIGIADHKLKPTKLIWSKADQLDVFIEGNKSDKVSKFSFANMGNIKVIIHSLLNEYN